MVASSTQQSKGVEEKEETGLDPIPGGNEAPGFVVVDGHLFQLVKKVEVNDDDDDNSGGAQVKASGVVPARVEPVEAAAAAAKEVVPARVAPVEDRCRTEYFPLSAFVALSFVSSNASIPVMADKLNESYDVGFRSAILYNRE